MIKRNYYSIRKNEESSIDLTILQKMFFIFYKELIQDEYFVKYLGLNIDILTKKITSESEESIVNKLYMQLVKNDLFPVEKYIDNYSEEDIFDMLEFLYDNCSKKIYEDYPLIGSYYDDLKGKKYFRNQINPILAKYKDGYEISEDGEILILGDIGFSTLFEAEIPTDDVENVTNKIIRANKKFRHFSSTVEDKRDAILELADVFEFLRPQIDKLELTKDENAIFNIANNFGIRHHNKKQKTDYDKGIWYSWIFYSYLAAIHTFLRMIHKST